MTKSFGSPTHQTATFAFCNPDHEDLVFESAGSISVSELAGTDFFIVTDDATKDTARVNRSEVLWYSVESIVPEDA